MGTIVWSILAGLVMVATGVFIIETGDMYNFKYKIYVDYKQYHWSVKWFVGGIPILIGLYILSYLPRKKVWTFYRREKKNHNVLICPKCDEPYNRWDYEDLVCPVCGGPMEPLGGYYERNPGLGHRDRMLEKAMTKGELPGVLDSLTNAGNRIFGFFWDLAAIPLFVMGPWLEVDSFRLKSIIVFMFLNSYVCELIFCRSLGKAVLGTQIVDQNWNRPSIIQLTLRFLIRLIPFEFLSGLKLGAPPRPWHDRWTKTWVVDRDLLLRVREARKKAGKG